MWPEKLEKFDRVRDHVASTLSADEILIYGRSLGRYYREMYNEDFDGQRYFSDVLVPSVYSDGDGPSLWLWIEEEHLSAGNFPLASESRDKAWHEIEDAGGSAPSNVPDKLKDAWNSGKRSREYINATVDKLDLDTTYYHHAFKGLDMSA